MTRISNPFRYMIRQAPDGGRYGSVSCVLRFWFGQKYFIWKSKALHQTVNTFAIEIDQRLRLGLKGPEDIYKNICGYINRARVIQFEVEPVIITDNPAELLKEEYLLLQAGKKDENCLNVQFDPYLPKWLPETAVKEFYQFRTELQKKAKEKKKKRISKVKPKKNGKAKPKNTKVRSTRRSPGKKGSVRNRRR